MFDLMKSIFIVGQTATGKTDLAIFVAKYLAERPDVTGVDILSADSKQVFIGMDIVTGKDKEKFEGLGEKIKIHGIDLIEPTEEWSIAHFLRYAKGVVRNAKKNNHVLIVVGGSGLYIRSLIDTPATVNVPTDVQLRSELDKLPLVKLQKKLLDVDREKFESMNRSDRMNPRRLMRAIEVALSPIRPKEIVTGLVKKPLIIGLKSTKSKLEASIYRRVAARFRSGALWEAKRLNKKYKEWSFEARAVIGYQDLMSYQNEEINRKQLRELWTLREVQYAKRQLTWFKKMPVIWFSPTDAELQSKVATMAETWYTQA